MVWALLDSNGRLKAVADTQAGLTAGAGETIVDAGNTPLADGYEYNPTTQTWSVRGAQFAYGEALAAEVPSIVRSQMSKVSWATFGLLGIGAIRTWQDHLAIAANAAYIPTNQNTQTTVDAIRRELELEPNEWVANQVGWSNNTNLTGSLYLTVIPDDGSAWSRTNSGFASEPKRWANRAAFLGEFAKPEVSSVGN